MKIKKIMALLLAAVFVFGMTACTTTTTTDTDNGGEDRKSTRLNSSHAT